MSSPLPTRPRSITPLSPLPSQHPYQNQIKAPPSPPTPPTQALILSHPSARLSSSPASSPQIVDSPVNRTRSVRPEMQHLVRQGVLPGANFFEYSSEDEDGEGGWEDDNGTREISGLGIRDSIVTDEYGEQDNGDDDSETEADGGESSWERGRKRGRAREGDSGNGLGLITALPPVNQIPAHDSGTRTLNREDNDNERGEDGVLLRATGTRKARQMSLRRLGQVKIVHNHHGSDSGGAGTWRESSTSNRNSRTASPIAGLPKDFADGRGGGEGNSTKTRHRRNTSESIRADSILNAHVITMRALESLSPSASLSLAHAHGHPHPHSHSELPKSASFTADRHITLLPLSTTTDSDPNRPPHLPSHFIKTPYPFTAKKEFPNPRTRLRSQDPHRAKGKRVLGIVASDGEFDLRSRLERNEDAQGVIRTRSDGHAVRKGIWGGSGREGGSVGYNESIVMLSLRARQGEGGVMHRLEKVVIPSSLTTTSPERGGKKKTDAEGSRKNGKGHENGTVTLDFDDAFFAQRLHESYCRLAGSFFWRTFSARKLKYIQLGQISIWSGSPTSTCTSSTTCKCGHGGRSNGNGLVTRLLGARGGLEIGSEATNLFTEQNLLDLYRDPKSGKARYTWVHWARRVAASNGTLETGASVRITRSRRRAKSLDLETSDEAVSTNPGKDSITPSSLHPHATDMSDTITTIQFVHSFSALRIILALATILALSVVAALLWIFLGVSAWKLTEGRGEAERVGSGMLVGMLVLGIEMVGFGTWVVGSWWWV